MPRRTPFLNFWFAKYTRGRFWLLAFSSAVVGAVPLLVGVYQANIVVPADLRAADYPIAFTVNGGTSRSATISVGLRSRALPDVAHCPSIRSLPTVPSPVEVRSSKTGKSK